MFADGKPQEQKFFFSGPATKREGGSTFLRLPFGKFNIYNYFPLRNGFPTPRMISLLFMSMCEAG